jgi:hypothetical protein
LRSAYLGQFTDEVANVIVEEFEGAGIDWSYKQAAFLTRIFFLGEWGTRLFVDSERLADARRIAETVVARMSAAQSQRGGSEGRSAPGPGNDRAP